MTLTNMLVGAGWSFKVEEKSANLKIWKDGQGADIDQLQSVVDAMIADAVKDVEAERDKLRIELGSFREEIAYLQDKMKELDRLRKIEAAAKAYRDKPSFETSRELALVLGDKPEPQPNLVWEESVDGNGNAFWRLKNDSIKCIMLSIKNNVVCWECFNLGISKTFPTADEAKAACEKHAAEQAKGG